MPFKPGDKVVCISLDSWGLCQIGQIYTIKKYLIDSFNLILLEEFPLNRPFSPNRFQKANSHLIRQKLGIK